MIVRNRRASKSRERTGSRVRPNTLDFPQIRKEVKLHGEVGIIIKSLQARRLQQEEFPYRTFPK